MNNIRIITGLIISFFVINGAIVISKVCLWSMRQNDITYKATGLVVLMVIWLFIIGEGIKLYTKIKK